jgi:uncharacterized protein
MGRLLQVLIIFIGVAVGLMLLRRALSSRREPDRRADTVQTMVQCAHCGLHIPQAEALISGNLPYCSETHRKAGPRH